MSSTMTADPIVSQPEGQEFLSQIFLDHQVVRLSAELVVEVLGPDKIAPIVKDHRTWIGNFPTLWCDEVEVILVCTLGRPLEEVHIRYLGLGRMELAYWIRAM
jgi:hypothetical protein